MKSLQEFIEQYNNIEKLGTIQFELDENSLDLMCDKDLILDGYYIEVSNMINEMSAGAQRYSKDGNNPKQHGNRVVWTSKDNDTLRMGDHATQRQDRPVDKGGDGEHITTKEIIDMFIYSWSDIMEMYYGGHLKRTEDVKSFVILCKCYLEGSENNLHANGARHENKFLWAAWMINENYNTGKLDIIIRTIFRGSFFKHSIKQERIVIASNGYIKQKLPR